MLEVKMFHEITYRSVLKVQIFWSCMNKFDSIKVTRSRFSKIGTIVLYYYLAKN